MFSGRGQARIAAAAGPHEDNGRVMPFAQEFVDNIQPEPYVAFWG